LPAATDLGAEIEQALRGSRFLIVVCSPRSARSQWVEREIETFQRLHGPGRTFAVIVEGEPNTGDQAECFPAALRQAAPVAADARSQGDGKRNAKLKLLAGMLGVGFDELKQRDTQRRFRRLQAAIAVVLAVAAALAGLAIYANDKRAEAIADRQRAERVMEYLIYDLGDKLQPLGRLDIVESVQEQVDAYYADLGIEPTDPYARRNQAVALQRKGDLLLAQGDPAAATEKYRAALEIWEDLATAEPDDTEVQWYLAGVHDAVGGALQARGDFVGALAHYQSSLAIRSALANANPDNLTLQGELYGSHNLLGSLRWAEGDLAGALEEFRTGLAIAQSVGTAAPDDPEWQHAMAVAHSNVGTVLDQTSEPAAAQQEYQAGLVIAESLMASDPGNVDWQVLVATLHNNMGSSLATQGDNEAALAEYEEAVSIMERLVTSNPGNAVWQTDLEMYRANAEAARQALEGAARQ
jgi:tetratricopeptide (TPR) repeat protein